MAQADVSEVSFAIASFEVEGNTILPLEIIDEALKELTGPEKTAADVELARDKLEKLYHDSGYPTILVNIPLQTVEEGTVRLNVIESVIGRIRVSGNRYVTISKILRELPSLQSGKILYLPSVQEELIALNRNRDLKVVPVMMPGRELGAVDVELQVKDRPAVHASLEINNQSSPDTTDLRVKAMISYDNLWQKDHSLSLQYQTSPEDVSEVQVMAASYVLPSPWEDDHLLALYVVWSDSLSATGEGFRVIGKGNIFGFRYVIPLPKYEKYSHHMTFGLDYKDFDELVSLGKTSEGVKTPVTYLPAAFNYSASWPDATGSNLIDLGLNWAYRGFITDSREFEEKGFQTRGNYLYATMGFERRQELPWGLRLFEKLDGQISSQPLISNEQYVAGGMDSVRGYMESEGLGDQAVHNTLELLFPDVMAHFEITEKIDLQPYLFYDMAYLWKKAPLEGEEDHSNLHGIGVGVRGEFFEYGSYELDWGFALHDTDNTDQGDNRFHFSVKFDY
ncbi:MAG: ShlB/FhaC/HecB family hemolysin secretion/activation protein [Thermodesulfobacteriota bacterium]|nr:ShlB/FhaC/HecB family hemolysin secretion/activation protein [Thermodesulfobacteriota bacterium]